MCPKWSVGRLCGEDGGGDLVQERKKLRQFVGADEEATSNDYLGPPAVVRFADLRLAHQGDVLTNGVGPAEHLDHPAVELDHYGAEDDFVHTPYYLMPTDRS